MSAIGLLIAGVIIAPAGIRRSIAVASVVMSHGNVHKASKEVTCAKQRGVVTDKVLFRVAEELYSSLVIKPPGLSKAKIRS